MNIFVVSAFDFINSNSASAKRIRIISSMFNGTIVNKPYTKGKNIISMIRYFTELGKKNISKDSNLFYYYPTRDPIFEILWIIFMWKNNLKVYYDLNEKRNVISKMYSYDIDTIIKFISSVLKWPLFLLLEKAYRFNYRMIVISKNLERKFKNKTVCIYIPSLASAPNGVHAIKDKKFDATLGYFGTITLYKEDFFTLFHAISILNSKNVRFTLNIYGTVVRDLVEFERLQHFYDIKDQINMCPFIVDQVELDKAMKSVDLLVLIRRNNKQTRFGFSTKLAEYFLSGTVVIASDVSDNSLYIRNEENGFIVRENDAEGLAELLSQIYKSRYNLMAIGQAAINTAIEVFDKNIYSGLLNS